MELKRPTTPAIMTEGPAIHPPGPLVDWLNKNAKSASGARRLFRLPVVVRFQSSHHLALGEAFIGASEDDAGAGAIALSLDTGAMGLSLLSLLSERCPPPAEACTVWLDGTWGPLFDSGESVDAAAGV